MIYTIKTIESRISAEDFDNKINAFMKERRENLAVRTNIVLLPSGSILYQGNIFYNESFATKELNSGMTAKGPVPASELPKTELKKGALWIQEGSSITGKYNDEKYKLEPTQSAALQINGKLETTIGNDKVAIYKNLYKKTATHPDYIIKQR